ncbi:hypothetical protein VB738_10565 [Cyanobium gracile UHCC 0139]|jgi:hypothetical protein|uniref:Uncharacterized protein n=1 Tax=Cyanobium gracile UHCC 0139 TaxID=3110308 RepID=A0ABU5RVA4_9CYAN|nr:hypothetical protein [Cyanobium gracile]MEA5391699.1 hypothetical protein [Cyanobium gracile UHCC 0139]
MPRFSQPHAIVMGLGLGGVINFQPFDPDRMDIRDGRDQSQRR